MATWTGQINGHTVLCVPRVVFLRTLLNVAVPSIYAPSADEIPSSPPPRRNRSLRTVERFCVMESAFLLTQGSSTAGPQCPRDLIRSCVGSVALWNRALASQSCSWPSPDPLG